MRFYFPDSQDLISPTYDFVRDEYAPLRVRQRDDRYAHEILTPPPYNGMLVSKAIVDGTVNGSGKYTLSQRERMYRLGVRRFFRLPDQVATLGDCGAFNYVGEERPPYTVNEVLDFYEGCSFDAGISIDHVILGYRSEATEATVDSAWAERRQLSLNLAEQFLAAVEARGCRIEPVGAAQGWNPASYADSVRRLQDVGYRRIALGGMVSLKTSDILDCLQRIDEIRNPVTELHLLGITRLESMELFSQYGVTSFDSTSPFRQAFMDDRNNYHTDGDAFAAIRVPQVDGNVGLKRRILSGSVSQTKALATERECLKRLRAYDAGTMEMEDALVVLMDYEKIMEVKRSYFAAYQRTLESTPWKYCLCSLCRKYGIEIIIFRGSERNKRRGFHNLSVFDAKMRACLRPIAH